MKTLSTIFFLLLTQAGLGQTHDGSALESINVSEQTQQGHLAQEVRRRESDLSYLELAKFALLSGDTAKAERYLSRVSDQENKLKHLINRYLALSAFMQDDFQSAYDLVKDDRLNIVSSYEQICLMRLMTIMALGNKNPAYETLTHEYSNCRSLTQPYTKTDHFWLTSMKRLSQGNLSQLPGSKVHDFTSLLQTDDTTKLWMKLAIYSNREKAVIENIGLLPPQAYRNIAIRELIGMAYYRAGDPTRANAFIEDLSSPNADNIRGDIALSKKEWEIAYGHFRLALKRKDDSLNALERAIPLTWLLGQWQDGIELLSRYVGDDYDQVKLLTLETALRIRLNQFDRADRNLRFLASKLVGAAPLEIKLMQSFVATMREELPLLKESATGACRLFDGINCWVADQLLVWDDLSKTIKRTDEIHSSLQTPAEILEQTAGAIQPLKEKVLIDQRDIEELDSSMVRLQVTQVQ